MKRRLSFLCRCAPCVESATDSIETPALVYNNIQASSEDILIQLGVDIPLCAIVRIVGHMMACVQVAYNHLYSPVHGSQNTKCNKNDLTIIIK